MDTYLVTAENVALFFRAGEPIEARKAVQESLRRCGFAAWPELEAEIFRSRRGTLLLARPAPPACVRGLAVPVRRRRRQGGK